MFPYSDPVATGVLEARGALPEYRASVHALYRQFARLSRSAFVLLDAFEGIETMAASIPWVAYPRTANAPDLDIDHDRFNGGPGNRGLQDEYVEWRVVRDGNRVVEITFVTEFPEYYEALAGVGLAAIQAGIRDAIPGSEPTEAELFGRGFAADSHSSLERQMKFLAQLPRNPWQTGEKGILCLQHGNNTMGALFNLVGECAVALAGDATDACENAAQGACGPDRNSDPRICTAAQIARRDGHVISLADPVGIRLVDFGGIWKLDDQQINLANRPDLWRIGRNGRRATLKVPAGLTIGDDPVESGAQAARFLNVSAAVKLAAEADVPAWARTGNESSRQIT